MDLTTEELIKLIEETKRNKDKPKKKAKKKLNNFGVDKFIKKFNVKSGLDYVPTYVIFYHYYRSEKEPCNNRYFFRLFSKHFQIARIGKQRRYLIDAESSKFDMTKEGLQRAKKFQESYQKRKK